MFRGERQHGTWAGLRLFVPLGLDPNPVADTGRRGVSAGLGDTPIETWHVRSNSIWFRRALWQWHRNISRDCLARESTDQLTCGWMLPAWNASHRMVAFS